MSKLNQLLKKVGLGTEEKPSLEAIKNQYYKICAEAGELQYKLRELESVLADRNKVLGELNKAYSMLLQEQAQPKAEEKK